MDVRPWPSRNAAQDLSKAERFALAGLTVDPPTRRIIVGDREELLEPRVMRVLVALDLAAGKVLSRDDLIALCWDGLIVGDNAINRVISRLRAVLAELAGNTVRLETITKVGFRLIADAACGAADAPPSAPIDPSMAKHRPVSRRTAIGGALAAVAAGAVAFADWRNAPSRHRPDKRAVALYDRGILLQKTAELGTTVQAIAHFKQAIEIDPGYADAWGALAMSYLHTFAGFSGKEQAAIAELQVSAARRALEIDPDQPDGFAAAQFTLPHLGNFPEMDKRTRTVITRHPDFWYGHAKRAMFLRDTGRPVAALDSCRRVIEIDRMLPIAWGNMAMTYMMVGDLQRMEFALDEATKMWPAHSYLWPMRINLYAQTAQFEIAAVIARDSRSRPDYIAAEVGEKKGILMDSIAQSDRRSLDRFRGEMLQAMDRDPVMTMTNALLLAVMGFGEDALGALQRVFALAAKDVDLARRLSTMIMFCPVILAFRSDPRHAQILAAVELEDYWKRSGSQPDFRRN